MIKELIDRVLASFKEDCDNITNLYGEEVVTIAVITRCVMQLVNYII